MAYLTREQILEAHDLKEEDVSVPEWGGKVKVRSLTLAQRQSILSDANRDGRVDDLRLSALLFVEGVCEPKFDKSEYMTLARKSNAAVERVNVRILDLSAWKAEAAEDAAKNSEATESSDSSSN